MTETADSGPASWDRHGTVYVAGHRGMVGSAICRALNRAGCSGLIGRTSSELDLRDRDAVFDFFAHQRPEVVVLAAARVGGILANSSRPADFLSDNLQIQVNVMDAARMHGVHRLLFLGSSCIYPKFADQPIKESALLTGRLEPTNDAYAIAKIAGITQVQALRRQHGVHYISAMPTNLYGPGDNFHPESSHVLPALVRRFHDAKDGGAAQVVVWGTGTPRREFLHADDLADAVLFLLDHYDDDLPINVGFGSDITIRELAETVADIVGYSGNLVFDHSKPDGTPRKLLDTTRLAGMGWNPRIPLRDGLQDTYRWFIRHRASART